MQEWKTGLKWVKGDVGTKYVKGYLPLKLKTSENVKFKNFFIS